MEGRKKQIFILIIIIVAISMVWFLQNERASSYVSQEGTAVQKSLPLVREGQAGCVIIHGADDEYAGKRLQDWFAEEAKTRVPVVTADKLPAGTTAVILLGTSVSNPLLRSIAASVGINIDPAALTRQGYVARTVHYEGRDWVILAGGGHAGVIYAVSDLMNWRLEHTGDNVSLAPADAREIPRFKYRWFWNWDNRMDWGGKGKLSNTMASVKGGAPYNKSADAFLTDTKRCVDYMADHKFNGMILWGFLRDSHGGVEAAKELSRYAKERGVRILPGVGASGYGGFYYEGRQLYNADTWLAAHPELRAIDENGHPYNALCPSKKANQKWLNDGAQWLFNTFDIGGVNLEMGDFLVCHCDDCKRARKALNSDDPDYYKDMAISHQITIASILDQFPDAWASYATYTGYTAEMMQDPPVFLKMIPGEAICQWTLTGMAKDWPSGVRPMAHHNLGYLHWCNLSTGTEDDFYVERIRNICQNASEAGFDGLDTYGELSPERPNVEVSYLAWEAFLWNPDMTIERFVDERLGKIYGGSGAARKLLEIIPLIRTAKERKNPENLTRARRLAEAAREMAGPGGVRRWDRLFAYLDRNDQLVRASHNKADGQ